MNLDGHSKASVVEVMECPASMKFNPIYIKHASEPFIFEEVASVSLHLSPTPHFHTPESHLPNI